MASESLKKQKRTRCAHFNGIQNKCCEVGIKYDSVRVVGCGYPCLTIHDRDGEKLQCESRRWPTEEEIEAECQEADRRIAKTLAGVAAIAEDAKKHGYGKGHGGNGEIDCPVCESGKLRYSVAGYNGHRHARCSTDGCVSFVE